WIWAGDHFLHSQVGSSARWLRLAKPRSTMLALMLRSIAAASEHRCFHRLAALRCVSKHEGHAVAVLILRDARTRVRLCGSACACALLRMRTAELAARRRTVSVIPSSRCQTAHLVPAAHFCARGLHPCFTHPEARGGRSAEKRSGARRNTRWACT